VPVLNTGMLALSGVNTDTTARQALALLEQAGPRQIGVGDWSWVLVDKSGAWAARVTPFDPAYRMYAEKCLSRPPLCWLPHLTNIIPLRRDGYVVVMERLWPADQDIALAFCAGLGIGCDSSDAPGKSFEGADDADLIELRGLVQQLLSEGARRFKLWGGSDIRPGNVMVDARGQLKLVDPLFLRGQAIVEALRDGRGDLLTDFSRCQIEDFLTIPVFETGGRADDLRRQVVLLYGEMADAQVLPN
jgi:hypothetical protein